MMKTISINKFRQNLERIIGQVVANNSQIKVRDGAHEFIVMSAYDWECHQETIHVMRDKELMRQLAMSTKTYATGAGYRPTKRETNEILDV